MSRDDLEHGWLVGDHDSENERAYTCGWCGEDICYGDEYYDLDGEKVCEDCIKNCRRTADD